MTAQTEERRAQTGRVLADAVRAAWDGDALRARRLLRLADKIRAPEQVHELLSAAEQVRTSLPAESLGELVQGGGGGSPGPRGDAPHARKARVRLPPAADLERLRLMEAHHEPWAPAPPSLAPTAPVGPGAKPKRPALPWGKWAGQGLVFAAALGGLAWTEGYRPDDIMLGRSARAQHALEHGDAAKARSLLVEAESVSDLVLRAEAALVEADTTAAVADLLRAAKTDASPGENAWAAAERLSAIGQPLAAAEAYLLAYAAGVPEERWGRIAERLEGAGWTNEASRVRGGIGR